MPYQAASRALCLQQQDAMTQDSTSQHAKVKLQAELPSVSAQTRIVKVVNQYIGQPLLVLGLDQQYPMI